MLPNKSGRLDHTKAKLITSGGSDYYHVELARYPRLLLVNFVFNFHRQASIKGVFIPVCCEKCPVLSC